jgi:hypothetical protein
VLSLVLVLLLVWFVLTVALAAWTLWFQGYIYSEPVGDIWWRAPAAGTALTLFLLLWVVLDYRAPGRYRELQGFSYSEDQKRYDELYIFRDGREEVYKRTKTAKGDEYRREGKPLPSRPDKVIVVEDGEKVEFLPERDDKGNFKTRAEEGLRYHDVRGREMVEGYLGQVTTRRTGWLFLNLLLNLMHLVVWSLCLWLLLRFQWWHAFGLAVVFWLVTTLLVLPMVLNRAEAVARERSPAKTSRIIPINPLPGVPS